MSTYIKLSTMEYPRHIGDIQLDPAGMADYALVEYVDPPAFDAYSQRRIQKMPQQQNGQWVMVWEVIPIPEPEMSVKVRSERNTRLAACDWTQIADSSADKSAWAIYRQELRDITKQSGFPWNVMWPTQPS